MCYFYVEYKKQCCKEIRIFNREKNIPKQKLSNTQKKYIKFTITTQTNNKVYYYYLPRNRNNIIQVKDVLLEKVFVTSKIYVSSY